MEPMWLQGGDANGPWSREGAGGEVDPVPEPVEAEVLAAPARVVSVRKRRTPGSWRLVVMLCACGVVLAPASVEPVRWWKAPSVVSALGVTPQQSTAIEQVYRTRLPAARRASEAIIGTTVQVATRVRDGAYDDELLDLTSQLVAARREQCERRREMLALSAAALSPYQREALLRMIEARRIME